MERLIKKIRCTGCAACVSVCPKQCVSMANDTEGFLYPEIDRVACVNCDLCEKVCPVLRRAVPHSAPAAYAAICKDEKIRMSSSSGGLFTVLAETVIEQGGVVFGARFDKRFKVVHNYAETKEELEAFRGSKYVQSRIGDTYKQVKVFLEQGRPVYFSGTPCQIAGLKSFLGKEDENLVCQDVICHGVSSPKVWEKYVALREAKAGAPARNISFRHKYCGWKRFSLSFVFEDDQEYRRTLDHDPYMRLFLRNVCLRSSCYSCAFKMPYGESDITLADFWGVEMVDPKMFDDRGVSLALVHTVKGKHILSETATRCVLREEDWRRIAAFNSTAYRSVLANPKREAFFNDMDHLDFEKLIQKYSVDPFFIRVGSRVKESLKIVLKRLGVYDEVWSLLQK